jgi:methyl-accepting chemotaxis protein
MVGQFAPDGQPLAGNLPTLPPDVRVDGPAQESVFPLTGTSVDKQTVRAIARRLPIGAVVVVGRNIDEAAEIADIVGATLGMGHIPALCLSVGAGIFLSMRAQKRVAEVNKKVQRIVAGDLRERLPARGGDDPFELAVIVSGMLANIETLIHEIAGVGDDIAHDLRTPPRVRVRPERGCAFRNAGGI